MPRTEDRATGHLPWGPAAGQPQSVEWRSGSSSSALESGESSFESGVSASRRSVVATLAPAQDAGAAAAASDRWSDAVEHICWRSNGQAFPAERVAEAEARRAPRSRCPAPARRPSTGRGSAQRARDAARRVDSATWRIPPLRRRPLAPRDTDTGTELADTCDGYDECESATSGGHPSPHQARAIRLSAPARRQPRRPPRRDAVEILTSSGASSESSGAGAWESSGDEGDFLSAWDVGLLVSDGDPRESCHFVWYSCSTGSESGSGSSTEHGAGAPWRRGGGMPGPLGGRPLTRVVK